MKCQHEIPARGANGTVFRCRLDAVEGQLYCHVHLPRHTQSAK